MNDFVKRLIYSVQVQAIALLTLLAFALYWQLRWQGFERYQVIPDILSFFLLALTFISLLDVIQRYYNSKRAFNSGNTALLILVITLVVSINYWIITLFAGSNDAYMHFIQSTFLFRLMAICLLFLFIHIRFWSNKRLEREEKIKQIAVQNERALVKIEMNSIQQQLKPHFLFNSLNSINALTMTDPTEAQRMVHLLSEFMRGSIQQDQNEMVPLADEIRHLQLYTNIEKVRFGDRLKVVFDVQEETLEVPLPFLILQPIIENAIKYGLYGNTEEVTINIKAEKVEQFLKIEVTNPYDSITQQTNKGTGFGIRSVERKLLLTFQRSNLLKTQEKNSIFTATLQIPIA
ncbi:MAG: histidine kinase [Crocinitomicaceae bacterium]